MIVSDETSNEMEPLLNDVALDEYAAFDNDLAVVRVVDGDLEQKLIDRAKAGFVESDDEADERLLCRGTGATDHHC